MTSRKIMKNLQEKEFKVVRVSKTEFELDNGDVHPIPFELDEILSIEEFQKRLDESKEIMLGILKNNG